MCGIAAFLSNRAWADTPAAADPAWLGPVELAFAEAGEADPAAIGRAVDTLANAFAALMSFATHAAAGTPATGARLRALADRMAALEVGLARSPAARDPAVERVCERLRDYRWQVEREVLDNLGRTQALMPDPVAADKGSRFAAWAIAQVLENLDRLEVRGRDSAGVAIQLLLPRVPDGLPPADAETSELGGGFCGLTRLADGAATVRFLFKTAQLIGNLGDNGAALRAAIRADAVLWRLAADAVQLNIVAHTRWASHGAITLANCHPVDGRLGGEAGPVGADADAVCVLNGDVDNYRQLVQAEVAPRGHRLPERVTSDTKIIPVLFRLLPVQGPRADRFLSTLRRLDGSVAIALQHPEEPERLFLGQRGSGQSLFVATTPDGLVVASENYGLAPRARASTAIAQLEKGGLAVVLSTVPGEPPIAARSVDDGAPAALSPQPMEIFARDIFRGDFPYFFAKEVHEAPDSVRKTLVGRYTRAGRAARFDGGDGGAWAALRRRLNDPSRAAIRRIFTTGQGTAAIAASGLAHLLRQALPGSGIAVEAAKASELSVELEGVRLDDALVIAISQSGTTTDTNRTVDLARAAGAWVHAIVNRRNSPLVRKADSHLFTSDGRDIEMAVASTKAFYAQIAAGKLTALCLADALGTLPPERIHDELVALETLPDRIRAVLDMEPEIAAMAGRYAPTHRYWAVVGNGANRIAAEEIRIKLSELCYKSIPVDFTEDKKHIDLSTEPLTLVVANDLPSHLAQDTAKEVAIFKAHNGKPIVFAAAGETAFDAYAEALLRLPSAGAGLDFVLATVAGHLWGYHAARAIDRGSAVFRALASRVDGLRAAGRSPDGSEMRALTDEMAAMARSLAAGDQDAALPPRLAAGLALLLADFAAPDGDHSAALDRADALLRAAVEETSRPIDTIRHQAKTVTVGISRPGREIGPVLMEALAALGTSPANLAEHDRRTLIAISPVVVGIAGGLRYRTDGTAADGLPLLQTAAKTGLSAARPSSFDAAPKAVAGSKRRALRLGRASFATGPHGAENLILIPTFTTEDWRLDGLLLLHAELAPQAALQQKLEMLRALALHDDLLDAFTEASHATGRSDFAAHVANLSPRDLLFRTPAELATLTP